VRIRIPSLLRRNANFRRYFVGQSVSMVGDQIATIALPLTAVLALDATPAQIRLGRLLGREAQPRFAHHPLVRRADGTKLSKADGAQSIGELLDAGRSVDALFAQAARAVGWAISPLAAPGRGSSGSDR
jgi:hypothetical protein